MSDLIGYKGSAKSIAAQAVENLMSTEPYWGFSIRGARRSGRSSFFAEVSEHLNECETIPINCFVGELVHATPEGFEQALLESIMTSNLCSNDYSSNHRKVRTPEEFFILCSDLYENEGKSPVFLIDMGKALEEQCSNGGMDDVIDLTRLLRYIYNLLKEKNISLILCIGLTPKFVSVAAEFAEDVFIQRYQSSITLMNVFFEGKPPYVAFQQIVQKISGLEIPDRYQGLWRGDAVTAGQLGENLKDSETSEITSQSLWQNLKGKWDILRNIQLEEIPPNELGELILADEIITDDRYRGYLEPCDGGYRANDQLYDTFRSAHHIDVSLCSPRRDPSTTKRIKIRVEDPQDDEVVGDLLSSIGRSMTPLGLSDIHEPEVLGHKSGLMEAQVDECTDPDLSILEKELLQGAFPRKLVTVVCLTSSYADDLKERLKEYAEEDCFILILCRDGIDFGSTPLGRYVRDNIKSVKKEKTISLEEITSFLSNQDEVLLDEVINNWVSDAVSDLFSKKPVLCVGHQTIKRLISGTISTGTLPIDSFAQQVEISQMDAKKCLKLLVQPQILAVKKGIAIWEPHNDVILRILLEYSGNEDKVREEIKNLYTIDHVDINDLASLYQCIPGGLTKDRILDHSRAEQDHQLREIGEYLDGECRLDPFYTMKYEEYRRRSLCEIEDITPYRTDIIKLLEDVKSAKEKKERDIIIEREELSKKIEVLKQKLVEHSNYWSEKQLNEYQGKVDRIRSLTSPAFHQIEREIHKQKDRVESLEKRIEELTKQSDLLRETSDKTVYEEIKCTLKQIQDLRTHLNLEDAETQIKVIEKLVIEQEKLRDRQEILKGTAKTDSSNEKHIEDYEDDGPPGIDTPSKDGEEEEEKEKEKEKTLPTDDLGKEKKFDLSNPEERKELAKTLLIHKEKINKIDVQVDL